MSDTAVITPALQLREVTVRFGGLRALDGLDLSVLPGEIVGLIGPNGAGKTTALNVMTGIIRPNSGTVSIAGRDCTSKPVARRARLGLSRTFQRVSLLPELSVGEHVRLAAEAKLPMPLNLLARVNRRLAIPDGFEAELLRRVGVSLPITADVKGLPLGMARLIEVAMSLASSPSVLLLDEPLSGLVGSERETLCLLLEEVRTQDHIAVVVVEHDVESVARTVDRIVVLDFGRKIADGPSREVLADPTVRTAYFGLNEASA